MPVSQRTTLASRSPHDSPDRLRPYIFHGIDLVVNGSQANGDCPFCNAQGKFTVQCDTGLWRCWLCGGGQERGGGNPLTFLRALHAQAAASVSPSFGLEVANNRRLHEESTPLAWGACRSLIPPYPWLIPGYGPDKELNQLYKRTFLDGSWKLLPTPGVWSLGKAHSLHFAVEDFDLSRPSIVVCEGPWDGMALWELRNELQKEIGKANIIAVPGCSVWRDEWSAMCKGATVYLLYDSDHPRAEKGQVFRSGYDGMRRVAGRLTGHADSVKYIRWGPDGYDPEKPNGWDLRDALTGVKEQKLSRNRRVAALTGILLKVEDAPADWFTTTSSSSSGTRVRAVESQYCESWKECLDAWQQAMQWRREMSDALSVLLAVCASTQQAGNQLFLQLVGSAGSGKTTMCEGLLVSHHCHHLEHLTGFHSGWKESPKEDGSGYKDCSLIARINGKTLVTPEADVLMSSPRFIEIMSQQRRIFDGKSGATYKNTSEDTLYVGLRTPWIMAGTPALMDTDQSRLGDRFLRVIIHDPTEEEKRSILRSAIRSERVAMLAQANGTAGSLVDPKTRLAQALTGGYVDWLRANVEQQLLKIEISAEAEERCIDLAELSADLRARPNEDKRKKETHDTKELPTRLARQNIRLAAHLAVVLNKTSVDEDILSIVRKVALDTAHGHSLNITKWLCTPNPKVGGKTYQECGGLGDVSLATWCLMSKERMTNYLLFLRKIGVLEMRKTPRSVDLWRLTDRVYNLYQRVMKPKGK